LQLPDLCDPVLAGDQIGFRREAVHTLRRCCCAAWIIDRPPALLSQRRGESQAARACIQGRRERLHRVGEPELSLIQFYRGSTCP
jgi:hypothetical protein